MDTDSRCVRTRALESNCALNNGKMHRNRHIHRGLHTLPVIAGNLDGRGTAAMLKGLLFHLQGDESRQIGSVAGKLRRSGSP